MSTVWGNTHGKMSFEDTEISLPYSVVAVNFMVPEHIMHQSVISETGHRSWSRKEKFVEFIHAEYLWKYDNPGIKANQILACEDQTVVYHFMSGGLVHEMYVEKVEIRPIAKEDITYEYGVAVIHLKSMDYIRYSALLKEKPTQKFLKFKGGDADGKKWRSRGITL